MQNETEGNSVMNEANEPKVKAAKKPLVKQFDLYIIRKFIGTFFFIILMLLLVIIMFDINE